MSETIRIAVLEDAEELWGVIYRAYEPIRKLDLHWPAATASIEAIRNNIISNECYLLEEDGVIASTITLSLEGEVSDVTDLPFIKWFAVDPVVKGRGLGARLIEWVEQSVIRGKYMAPAVSLATAERHPWLAVMYKRRGYDSFLEFDSGNGDGRMFLMRKVLDQTLFEAYVRDKPQDKASVHERALVEELIHVLDDDR